MSYYWNRNKKPAFDKAMDTFSEYDKHDIMEYLVKEYIFTNRHFGRMDFESKVELVSKYPRIFKNWLNPENIPVSQLIMYIEHSKRVIDKNLFVKMNKSDQVRAINFNYNYIKYADFSLYSGSSLESMLTSSNKILRKRALNKMTKEVWESIPPSLWYNSELLCYPEYAEHCDFSKLAKNHIGPCLKKYPKGLQNHRVSDFGLKEAQWRRIFKSTPKVLNYLSDDAEKDLLMVKLKIG